MTPINNLLTTLRSYRYFIKTMFVTFGILVGQMIAWFFILPLDYTYIPASFFIVRWLPIPSVGLFLFYICWKTWNIPITQSQGGQIDIFSKVSMINNNYFDKGNTGSQGIELNINTNNSTSIIQGNYVTKNLYGIIIHSGNRAKLNIYGNMFDNVGEGIGIFNNATNYFIHGNYFSNDKYYSIWIQGTNNNGMVIGNFIN